ncbi:hypothetical protein [Nocardioides pelophilus]|uniref:hypothetical protein n=1 Tax=Nocardioides pelophilus TaxID=2172019 RepID=UPI0016045B99|nr:hypothetical protein [Nocardioides pelophilus]
MTAVSDTTALWWICIGIGIVVALVVVVLLCLLSAFVGDIGHHVGVVAVRLDHLDANTGSYPHLHETAQLIHALGVEVGAHVQALSSKTGPL